MSCLTLKRSRRLEDESPDEYTPKKAPRLKTGRGVPKRKQAMDVEAPDIHPAKRQCKSGIEAQAETSSPAKGDQKLFTFNQLQAMCCRMINQKDEELSEHYECQLTEQLTAQYDTFIKFTHDQMLGGGLLKNSSYLS
ncbi:akirin-2 isoform X2 [Drosophila persimilis]|uniref:akirin-2 isoform X2 n=1 Tax=Drosophila persimilis TaxID=7234 RepID=UPI000F083463|nr:akirin-2 isoform X2 [Drosophila persimilis]